jgi:cytochrome P450
MIDDRRSGKTKSHFGDDGDLLGILLQNELYRGDDEKTKDELVVLFLAGNETIKTSSTNTVCYLTMLPEIKAKFMSEITPVMEKFSDNFVEKLTIDEVESFDYVRRCWFESMRMQPPTPTTTVNKFIKTVRINGIEFTPETTFCVDFNQIHTDPKEWINPERYEPDRFNPKSPMYLRPDGKMRNKFSFCPFFGGKRICLGKTLAEYMTTFTLPLIMYHFDFEFLNPQHATSKPNFQLFQFTIPVIPMKMKTLRKLKPQPK